MYTCGQYIENNPLKAGLVNQSKDWEYSSCRHYQEGAKDELIDAYASPVREMKDVVMDKEGLENGNVIGSRFFKFQFFKDRKLARRVP